MRRTRSEGKSKLWLFGGHEYVASREELFFWNILITGVLAGLVGFLLVSGARALVDLADPRHPLWASRAALSEAQIAAGQVRIAGTVQQEGPTEVPPLCLVTYEIKSGKSWSEVFRQTAITGAVIVERDGPAGEQPRSPERQQRWTLEPAGLRWIPADLKEADEHARVWRARYSRLRTGGRIKERCLAADEAVYISACRTSPGGTRLGACPDSPATLAPGSHTSQPIIDQLANKALFWIVLSTFGVLAILLYLWRLVRRRTLPRALMSWSIEPRGPSGDGWSWTSYAMAGVPLALLFGYALIRWLVPGLLPEGSRLGYMVALVAMGGAGLLRQRVVHRSRALQLAIAPVEQAPTLPLAQAGVAGQVVELAVRVSEDAPTVPGPLSRTARAYCKVLVDAVVRQGKNHECHRVLEEETPHQIPIADASGQGMLDLSEAVCDLRALQQRVSRRAAQKGRLTKLLGQGPFGATFESPSDRLSAYVVEEQFLDPGEPVYILGQVTRVEPHAQSATGYRQASTLPVVGGNPTSRLVVYAGDERSLLTSLRREVRYLWAVKQTVTALILALVGVTVFMAAL